MSRTKAHQPYYMLLLNPKTRIAIHDHRNNICDLPDPTVAAARWKSGEFRLAFDNYCYWDIDWHAVADPYPGWQGAVRNANRSDRRRARQLLAQGEQPAYYHRVNSWH